MVKKGTTRTEGHAPVTKTAIKPSRCSGWLHNKHHQYDAWGLSWICLTFHCHAKRSNLHCNIFFFLRVWVKKKIVKTHSYKDKDSKTIEVIWFTKKICLHYMIGKILYIYIYIFKQPSIIIFGTKQKKTNIFRPLFRSHWLKTMKKAQNTCVKKQGSLTGAKDKR